MATRVRRADVALLDALPTPPVPPSPEARRTAPYATPKATTQSKSVRADLPRIFVTDFSLPHYSRKSVRGRAGMALILTRSPLLVNRRPNDKSLTPSRSLDRVAQAVVIGTSGENE